MPLHPDTPPQLQLTPFRKALASSGLVDGLVLHRLAREVADRRPGSAQEQDDLYIARLVELGLVNAWQIDQLRQGRTKFSLGPYRILNSIGRGGMGHVFLGEHEMLGRVEAIKVLPRDKTTPETIANFRHEIRSQARLDHPNLVRISFADRDGETYFLVTEYVPGIDLRRLIRRLGPLEERVAAWVVSEAARGVHFAHENQLVHRDVKPGNLLLTNEGDVKVTDLGLAWRLDRATTGSPSGGKIVGTSDYLAPETIRDPGLASALSDVYSLGCTLYYALTGKVPHPGGTHMNKMKRHLAETPADPRRFQPGLSEKVVGFLGRMLAKKPENRMASAAVVHEALSKLTQGDEAQLLASLVADAVQKGESEADNGGRGGSSNDSEESAGLPDTVSATVQHAPEMAGELSGPFVVAPTTHKPATRPSLAGVARSPVSPSTGSPSPVSPPSASTIREPAQAPAHTRYVLYAITALSIGATAALIAYAAIR